MATPATTTPSATATPAPPTTDKPAAAQPQTPPAPVKMGEAFQSRLRGEKPKPEAKTEPKVDPATPPVAPATPPAPEAGKGDEGKTPETPKPTPAQRVIRRKAKDYVDDPASTAIAKLTDTVGQMAEAVKTAVTPRPAKTPEPELAMSEEEKRRFKVIEAMAEMNKDRFSEMPSIARKLLAEFPAWEQKWNDTFRKQWESDNDNDDFATEKVRDAAFRKAHTEAFEEAVDERQAKYGLDYSANDFEDAKVFLATKPVREQLERNERELAELKKGAHEQKVAPVAKLHGDMAVTDFAVNLRAQDKEFEDFIGDDGAIDMEKVKTLPDAKIVEPILNSATESARAFGEAAVLALRGGKTPHEDLVFNVCLDFEADMASKTPEEQVLDGKAFSPALKFAKMSAVEKAKHWTVDADKVIAFANDNIIRRATEDITARRKARDDQEKEFRAKYKLPDDAQPAMNGNGAAHADKPTVRSVKPKIASTTDATPTTQAGTVAGSSRFASLFKQNVISTGLVPK